MNKIAFGQYYHSNSMIHKMDSRIKIIINILFMISIFLIPTNNFMLLTSLFLVALLIILLTKVPIKRYLGSDFAHLTTAEDINTINTECVCMTAGKED